MTQEDKSNKVNRSFNRENYWRSLGEQKVGEEGNYCKRDGKEGRKMKQAREGVRT